jgi:hypothetical protein
MRQLLFQASDSKVVLFQKLGQLSPQKKAPEAQSPSKKVVFEKLGSLSPAKSAVTDLADLKAKAARVRSSLCGGDSHPKMTPQEVKAKLGTVTKLSDLQAKLKAINDKAGLATSAAKASSHRRALFATPAAASPKLSQDAVTLEIVKVTRRFVHARKSILLKKIAAHFEILQNWLLLSSCFLVYLEFLQLIWGQCYGHVVLFH